MADGGGDVLLNYKARQLILKALRSQIAAWESQTEEELGEDTYADVQNDLLYAEGVLAALEQRFRG